MPISTTCSDFLALNGHLELDKWSSVIHRLYFSSFLSFSLSLSLSMYIYIYIYVNSENSDDPLYMYIALQNNHVPMEAPESYIKMNSHIEDPNRRLYAAMASALDDAIGNITAALKDTGRWNNTVLIFNSDNGAEIDVGRPTTYNCIYIYIYKHCTCSWKD